MHKIEINKHIPQERWGEFFEMFSHGNKGRLIEMELLDQEKGDEQLIQAAPLASIDFQLTPEGASLIIHAGENKAAYSQTIDFPTEVWTGQDENGVVTAMDITDQHGNHTIVKLADLKVRSDRWA
jgi:Family of unknown function (DUF5335)